MSMPAAAKNYLQQSGWVVQPRVPALCSVQTTLEEEPMENVVRLSKRLVPVEQIAVIEPFVAPADYPLRTTKQFNARVVLLDRVSILSEASPEQLSQDYGFRFVPKDRVGTNPAIAFRVEEFAPAENFAPSKPYLSRLVWKDRNGSQQSKLMLSTPEELLSIVVRGEDMDQSTEPGRPTRARAGRRNKPRRSSAPRPEPV
jgi:hypothetical protein